MVKISLAHAQLFESYSVTTSNTFLCIISKAVFNTAVYIAIFFTSTPGLWPRNLIRQTIWNLLLVLEEQFNVSLLEEHLIVVDCMQVGPPLSN